MPEKDTKDTTEKKKTDQLPTSKDRIMTWVGIKRPLPDNYTVDVRGTKFLPHASHAIGF